MNPNIFTLHLIDKAIEHATGMTPYLYGDSSHSFDLRDRSVARDIMIEQIDWPNEKMDPERRAIRMAALDERCMLWTEYKIPWYLVTRHRGISP